MKIESKWNMAETISSTARKRADETEGKKRMHNEANSGLPAVLLRSNRRGSYRAQKLAKSPLVHPWPHKHELISFKSE